MQIKQVAIDHFRGIESLRWDVQSPIVCLIGPADSTKSTILDAIEYTLTSQRFITFTDADFHLLDVECPIEIVVTVGHLPKDLLDEGSFGLHLRGWHQKEGLVDEPERGTEKVISIKLSVDKSLEPAWRVITERLPEGKPISANDRAKLGIARLGSDVERHLSWGWGSALSRMTEDRLEAKHIISEALRQARNVVSKAKISSLKEIANQARTAASSLGVQARDEYSPALDPYVISKTTGALSLHEGVIPLRLAGLGSKRLIAFALQLLCVQEGAILLIDEVEHGLEPHRIRNLLRSLSNEVGSGQVIMTSHSPTVTFELDASKIHVVHCEEGKTEVRQVPSDLQATIRSTAEALHSRRIIVCEGKTEVGLCRGFYDYWVKQYESPLTCRGVVPVNGGGSNSAPNRAIGLAELGYAVSLFVDSERPIGVSHEKLDKMGIKVVQWDGNVSTEERICSDVPWACLKDIVKLAALLESQESIRDSISYQLGGRNLPKNLDLEEWKSAGIDESDLRRAIGGASKKNGWFKDIDRAIELAKVIIPHMEEIAEKDLGRKLRELGNWAHGH